MKKKISSEQIKAMIDLYETNVKEKDDDFNLFIVNTPKGQVKVKSKLTYNEFLKEYNLKRK